MRVKEKNDLDNSMFVLELLRKTSRKWFMNEYFLFTLGYENWDKRRSSKQK